ncbi:MAG: hypothetical protein JSR58_04925 [Verrucomicrobia bacterium]|nr:hypothetical protein [Verrucomicrobiota bacterium]
MFKKSIFIIFLLGAFLAVDYANHPRGMRFKPAKITAADDIQPISLSGLEINRILDQKFTYFDKGSQTYVFISEDSQYVLKFLKQTKLYPKTWLAYLPFTPLHEQHLQYKEKRQRTFDALTLAMTEFREDTGLLYVHLGKTHHLHKQVELTDRKKKKHIITLDSACFVIQKKAHLLYPYLSELAEKKDLEKAQKVIASFYALVDRFAEKGVVAHDPILHKNFGVLEDRAIQFDVGRMKMDPQSMTTDGAIDIRKSFDAWIAKNHPELLPSP